jgi:GNAT superfamily N-acetyltransferase
VSGRGAPPTLFRAAGLRAVILSEREVASLQAFFEANPEYFHAVGGEPPRPDEGEHEFHDMPPAPWTFRRKWVLGFLDGEGAMQGTATIISDLFAEGVWTLGLFVVATARHGSGAAPALYEGLEAWMRAEGARWSRLGVVVGNARAERFWDRAGYVEVRRRGGVEMGKRVNTLRVMVKSLAGGAIPAYLASVPRDQPGSP